MSLLGVQTLAVVRRAAGSYVDGVWSQGSPSSFSIVGSVQSLSAKEIETLPEGARTRAKWILICEEDQPALQITDLANSKESDKVTFDDLDYLVMNFDNWTAHTTGLPYRSYVLLEIGEDEG